MLLFIGIFLGSWRTINSSNFGLILPENVHTSTLIMDAVQSATKHMNKNVSFTVLNSKMFSTGTKNELPVEFILDSSINSRIEELKVDLAIKISNELSDVKPEPLIIFRSPMASLTRLILDVVNHQKLHHVVILYDLKLDFDFVPWLRSVKTKLNINFYALDQQSTDSMEKILRTIRRNSFQNIILIGEAEFINLFFDQIQKRSMFRAPNMWTAITKSVGEVRCRTCPHAKYTLVQPDITELHEYKTPIENLFESISSENLVEFYFYHDLTKLVLLSLLELDSKMPSCKSKFEIECNRKSLFSEIIFRKSQNFFGRFGGFSLSKTDQDFNFFFQRISFKISRIDQTVKQFSSRIEKILEYNEPSADVIQSAFIEDAEEDEELLRIITLIQPPFVMKHQGNQTSNNVFYGFLVDILEVLKRELGSEFPDYEIFEDESGLYGISNRIIDSDTSDSEDEVTWNGVSAMFKNEQADLGLVAMTITDRRDEILKFSEPIFEYVGIVALVKKPTYQDHSFVYATVLEKSVWLSIIAAYILTSFVITIFDYFNSLTTSHDKEENKIVERVFTFKESLWFCFISLTPQGGGDGPESLSGRFVTATWWLFRFIVIASYTANLAAFLTVSRLDRNIETFDDLTKQYQIRYSAVEATATDKLFESMALSEEEYFEIWKDLSLNYSMTMEEKAQLAVWEYPITDKFKKIWGQMNEVEKPQSFEGAINRVRQSPNAKQGYALIGESPSLEWIENQSCDLLVLNSEFAYRSLALPIGKDDKFDLKKKIDPILKKLKDNGTLEKLRIKYWEKSPKKRQCQDYRKLSNGVSLRDSGGIFLIVVVGVISTLLVVSLENWIFTYWKNLVSERAKMSLTKGSFGNTSLRKQRWLKLMDWLKA